MIGASGLLTAALWGGCWSGIEVSSDPPRPVEAPEPPTERAPTVLFQLPSRQGITPAPITDGDRDLAQQLARVRTILHAVVVDHGRDPQNPWAIGHAMLALGADTPLTNDADPVDWLFEQYAVVTELGGTELVTFPTKRGSIRIEPHTDLILKVLTESGQAPDRAVTVEGRRFNLSALYRHSLWRAWIKGDQTGFQGGAFNDAPWALQGLAAWAPSGLSWSASGGRAMTMDGLTSAVIEVLGQETGAMTAAMEAGQLMQKDTRRGLFRYTCGGQHLLQGAAYAVARGFGANSDQAAICHQLDLLDWRIDVELAAIDPHIQDGDAAIKTVLLGQRLKFLGHTLETVHKIAAMQLCPLEGAHLEASRRVGRELVATVDALSELSIFEDLERVRTDASLGRWRSGGSEQIYLDFVGDAAHAVRGIDLATGAGAIRY
ncbi:MAG TPA: hypothetical protein ENK18_23335 [Deltaproteobacteria bacterium]|nr:hypothetical protein [Deltaproteobacteria bacterium]